MINLKTAHEIDLMARAGSLLASVLPPLKEACEPGVKTIELDRIADKLIREGGATPGFLGYHGFPRSIWSASTRRAQAASWATSRRPSRSTSKRPASR